MKALIRDKPLPAPTPGGVREQAEQQPGGLAKRRRWYDRAAFRRDPTVNERVGVFKRGGAESGIKEAGGGVGGRLKKLQKILGPEMSR